MAANKAKKKGKGGDDAPASESKRLNVHISPDAQRRLGIHCVMNGVTPGKLVEALINEHLRDWKVQANASARVITEDRPETIDSVSLGTASAA
jgi:hypothetical protein